MGATNDDIMVKKAITRAIVFFDVLDHPLTAFEVWKYLLDGSGREATLGMVGKLLDAGLGRIGKQDAFFFLSGREKLVEARRRSLNLAEGKMKRASEAVAWLRFIPGVKMAAVCNSLALGNVREESDIDLFIVTARRRIWLTRFSVTAAVHLLGLRRYGAKVRDKICLSFYVTEDDLDLEKVALDRDPYFYYWLAALIPLYDDGIFKNLIARNAWLKKFLPNFIPVLPGPDRRVADNPASIFLKRLYSAAVDPLLGDVCERLARYLQLKKMEKNTGSLAKENDTRVIISDAMLKFHETDRREEFRRQWENKLSRLEVL